MNRFLNGILKAVLPPSVTESLKLGAKAKIASHTHDELTRIQCDLTPAHVANTRLYANRNELLKSFQRGGTVAEVGVAQGEFSQEIWDVMQPHCLHLIDFWQSANPMYGQNAYEGVLSRFAPQVQRGSIVLHRKSSQEGLAELADNSLDCIYIDADHSYESVKVDLKSCLPKMKSGGVISGHDYVRWSGQLSRFGVIEAINEFCILNDYELIGLTLQRNMHLSYAIRAMK